MQTAGNRQMLRGNEPAVHPGDGQPAGGTVCRKTAQHEAAPKRTTAFQMVVNFVRKHWAQPGVTVTESKFRVSVLNRGAAGSSAISRLA